MTPQQKVEHVYSVIKTARQNQFTREQFVSMFNQLWDAIEGAEATAAQAQQLALATAGETNAGTVS